MVVARCRICHEALKNASAKVASAKVARLSRIHSNTQPQMALIARAEVQEPQGTG